MTVDRARDHYSILQKLNWWYQDKKELKEDVHTLVQNEEKHVLLYILELFRQECQRSRSSCRYKEIEEGELSNSLKI